MFSNVKKYSKNYKFKKVRNSNDQTLSSFGTFQTPPFLFGSMKKLAIHVLYTQQLNNCIAVETMHCCLFHSGLAVYQVQRVLITIIYCCCCTIGLLLCDECVPMPTCTIVHCKLCKVLKVCASLDCALHNCARGDFVHQCVI